MDHFPKEDHIATSYNILNSLTFPEGRVFALTAESKPYTKRSYTRPSDMVTTMRRIVADGPWGPFGNRLGDVSDCDPGTRCVIDRTR
jgi:hypothetical protein